MNQVYCAGVKLISIVMSLGTGVNIPQVTYTRITFPITFHDSVIRRKMTPMCAITSSLYSRLHYILQHGHIPYSSLPPLPPWLCNTSPAFTFWIYNLHSCLSKGFPISCFQGLLSILLRHDVLCDPTDLFWK